MQFDILTLFPSMFTGPLTESIIKRAVQAGLVGIGIHDIRAYTTDKHHTADDAPYGGGAGMVMKVEPLAAAIRDILRDKEIMQASNGETVSVSQTLVVLMAPAGELFNQQMAGELAKYDRLVLVCG